MIGNENFTSSEKLSVLLDGELKMEETDNLFYELANDPELQEEFHEMIDLKNMFKDSSLTPPAGLHTNIVAGTGLGLGSETSGTKGSKFSSFFGSKISLMLFSCLTGAFITFLVMNNDNGNVDNFADLNSSVINPETAKIEMASQKSIVPPMSNNINKDRKAAQFASLPVIMGNAGIGDAGIDDADNSLNKTESVQSGDNDPAVEYPAFVDHSSETKPRMIINHRDLSSNAFNTVYVPMQELRQSRIRSENEWSLTLRGFTSNSLSDVEIPPLSDPTFNNFSMSLMYNLNDNFSMGLEFGQENFMQKYSGEVRGRIANIKQNYLAFWGGAAGKYLSDPVDWMDGVQPYGKVFFGSTYLGPLMKEEVGLQYFVSKDFAMFFGAEFSHLAYFFKKETFLSHKFGTTYGIVIKF